jgi:RNA polymerase sigma factor (sigma-70 family)
MTTGHLGTVVRHIRKLAAAPGAGWTDGELLERFGACRDEDAFAALVQRHGSLVWSVCRNVLHHDHDAEDAFQATFLVLARNAGTIRKREALASWLHGVAFRSAMQVKRDAARRRFHEERAKTMPRTKSACEIAWRELQAVLDEEVERLPEKFRLPFVLCCLESKSKAEAAQQLGWKEGTVSGRLAVARKMLQKRLARRGMTISAALCATALAPYAASAALPARLVDATTQAAIAYVSGAAPTSVIPAPVVALAQGINKAMLLTKVRFVGAFLTIMLTAVGGAVALMHPAGTAPPEETSKQQMTKDMPREGKSVAQTKTANPGTPLPVRGRVLDPEGKPLAGAKLYRAYGIRAPQGFPAPARQRATTGADGRFQFTIAASEVPSDRAEFIQIVAVAAGYGPAWVEGKEAIAKGELILRLVKDDVPINGRIIDLEARPIAGVTVGVFGIAAPAGEDLAPFVQALKDKRPVDINQFFDINRFFPKQLGGMLGVPGMPLTVTTGKDGRFTLRGAGRERVIAVMLGGPNVASDLVMIRTRPGPKYVVPDSPGSEITFPVYGSEFDHPAAPPRPIAGTVRDHDTGKPLAGARVQFEPFLGEATTDKDGKYRINSVPSFVSGRRSATIPVTALGPLEQPYLVAIKELDLRGNRKEMALNFELKRGVWVKGRVTDKETGQPLKVEIEYYAFRDNPYLHEAPDFAGFRMNFTGLFQSKADGTFRIAALPGPGLIAASDHQGRYLAGHSLSAAEAANVVSQPFRTVMADINAIARINPVRDGAPVTCNLVLDAGPKLSGTVLGPDGLPLAGTEALGVRYGHSWNPLSTAAFTLTAVKPGERRSLLFIHEKKHLAGALLVQGREKGPLVVQMETASSVHGRLVDADGQPRPGVNLHIYFERRDKDMLSEHHPRHIATGEDGSFRVDNMVPGLAYQIIEMGKLNSGDERGVVASRLKVKSGEAKDLGPVRTRPFGR